MDWTNPIHRAGPFAIAASYIRQRLPAMRASEPIPTRKKGKTNASPVCGVLVLVSLLSVVDDDPLALVVSPLVFAGSLLEGSLLEGSLLEESFDGLRSTTLCASSARSSWCAASLPLSMSFSNTTIVVLSSCCASKAKGSSTVPDSSWGVNNKRDVTLPDAVCNCFPVCLL